MIISFASPPKPAIPSPFVTEPAASAATKVPCPTVSRTSAVPVRGLYVVGFFAAMSGALTSAPVSTTAIVTELAARSTQSGTRSSCVAVNCHSHGAPFGVAAWRPGSAAFVRSATRSTKRIPGSRDSLAASLSVESNARDSESRNATHDAARARSRERRSMRPEMHTRR